MQSRKKHKTWDALGMFQSIIIKNKNDMCVYVEKTKKEKYCCILYIRILVVSNHQSINEDTLLRFNQ